MKGFNFLLGGFFEGEQAATLAAQIAESALASLDEVVVSTIDIGSDRDALQAAVKTIQDRCPAAAVMLFGPGDDKVALIAGVPKPLIDRGLKAGDWIKEVAPLLGGKGGGRPDSAQGAGPDSSNIKGAIKLARSFAHKQLSGI